jgi:hypothetical protein
MQPRLALAGKVVSGKPEQFWSAAMSDLTLAEATENIYTSLRNDNAELEVHVAALKAAMAREGVKEAVFEPSKLAQNKRQGRKLMQSYFRKKGVTVVFAE